MKKNIPVKLTILIVMPLPDFAASAWTGIFIGVFMGLCGPKQRQLKWEDSFSGCWNCISHKGSKGYPVRKINGKAYLLSRFIWEECFGFIPEGLCVLHSCDNPACINPEHFFLGTKTDNAKDRDFKHRQARGERSGMAKLKKEQVEKIRGTIGTNVEIAKIYNVSQTLISAIRRNIIWKN